MKLSLSFFGSYPDSTLPEAYDLILRATKLADKGGFEGVWFPERHFDEFGALSPNPSILAAATSAITNRIKLRAGSVVAPLHHPVRVAEEWAVVDQLSKGRVEIALASGWHSHDFIFNPESFTDRKDVTYQFERDLKRLWRGEAIDYLEGKDNTVSIVSHPRPVQKSLQTWFAALGSIETFEIAGRAGAGILTNLILQDFGQLTEKMEVYRRARADVGLDPNAGQVAVLMHTYVAKDMKDARAIALQPLSKYLESSMNLSAKMTRQVDHKSAIDSLSEADRRFLLQRGTEKFMQGRSLIGGVDHVQKILSELEELGISEAACFVDFGIPGDQILNSLEIITNEFQAYLNH